MKEQTTLQAIVKATHMEAHQVEDHAGALTRRIDQSLANMDAAERGKLLGLIGELAFEMEAAGWWAGRACPHPFVQIESSVVAAEA